MLLIKEEFVGGEKWRRAVKLGGSDAIALWVALKCYCSLHPDTEGFIPDEELDELPGVPRGARRRALQALIECGRLLPGGGRGAGLLESAEGGWQLHDYLDHSAAPEEIELRRERARLRKQTYRESKRAELAEVRRLAGELAAGGDMSRENGGHVPWDTGDNGRDIPGDMGRDIPGDTGGTSLAGARPPAAARARTRGRAPALPNPTQPNQINLRRLTSTIRSARASPGPSGHPVEACAEHRQYAAEHGLDLEPLLDELRRAPGTSGLSPDEIRARLGAMILGAVEQRQAVGGAA